jgi:hypothetical protein
MISPQLHAKTPDLTRGEDWRLRGACRNPLIDPDCSSLKGTRPAPKRNEEEVRQVDLSRLPGH